MLTRLKQVEYKSKRKDVFDKGNKGIRLFIRTNLIINLYATSRSVLRLNKTVVAAATIKSGIQGKRG